MSPLSEKNHSLHTVFYQDHSHLAPGLHTRMTTYRTIVMVEVARDEE